MAKRNVTEILITIPEAAKVRSEAEALRDEAQMLADATFDAWLACNAPSDSDEAKQLETHQRYASYALHDIKTALEQLEFLCYPGQSYRTRLGRSSAVRKLLENARDHMTVARG